MTEAAVHTWEGETMEVALKIWVVDANGEREAKTYEGEAPDGACMPWLDPGGDDHAERGRDIPQQQMNGIHKVSFCRMCGSCVSECNAMGAAPDFLGPAALAKGMRFVGDARDHDEIDRLNSVND